MTQSRLLPPAALCALLLLAWSLAPADGGATRTLARHYLATQDMLPAAAIAALLLGSAALPARASGRTIALAPGRLAATLVAALLAGGWIGARLVMARHDLSRDEQMASFDALIFASGHLFAPFPHGLRTLWEAVNQTFILPIGDHEAWVSAYLPVNAAMRALFGLVDPTLTGPACAAFGALALWRIAVRLWPDARETQVVVLLLYAGSSQLWITAMTAYAMSAHLALNLAWLWLFLGRERWRHVVGLGVGLLATGLHQPVFHPLFVLPFLSLLVAERRWRLLGAYLGGYAAIGLFWLGWPLLMEAQATTPLPAAANHEGIGYLDRFLRAAGGLNAGGVGQMAANLVRFFAWQHLLLLPLLAGGLAAARRGEPIARALAGGLVLTVAAMLVLLPDQGLGWGYRYLHGLIGSACLLGGYGWQALGRAAPRRAMVGASVVSLAVLLPLHAMIAARTVAPFAAARQALLTSTADVVVIDDLAAPFAADLVLNRPDLANRPLLLRASKLAPEQAAALCRRTATAFFGAPQLGAAAAVYGEVPRDHAAPLRAAARAGGCRGATAGRHSRATAAAIAGQR